MLQNIIREVNHYRQMDTHGRPPDASLIVALIVVVALYTWVVYRLARRK